MMAACSSCVEPVTVQPMAVQPVPVPKPVAVPKPMVVTKPLVPGRHEGGLSLPKKIRQVKGLRLAHDSRSSSLMATDQWHPTIHQIMKMHPQHSTKQIHPCRNPKSKTDYIQAIIDLSLRALKRT